MYRQNSRCMVSQRDVAAGLVPTLAHKVRNTSLSAQSTRDSDVRSFDDAPSYPNPVFRALPSEIVMQKRQIAQLRAGITRRTRASHFSIWCSHRDSLVQALSQAP